jgi:putative zinc finger protein/WD40 repeat protein
MTMNRHEAFEELISASLTEELTDAERQWLDAHLDSCSHCRATLAAFADQRRIMGGLRHVAPPRDLGARVRTGIERGRFASVPFWRRPAVIFAGAGGSLAAVAGALLAIVLLNGSPRDPEVGQTTPTPTPTLVPQPTATATPTVITPTLPPVPASGSPAPPGESAPPPSTAPSETPNPVAVAPEPDVFLAFTGTLEDPALKVEQPTPPGESPPPATEVDTPSGPPIAAELSPDGQWLAYITEVGLSGMNEVRATRVAEAPAPSKPGASAPPNSSKAVGETLVLGSSAMGTAFVERLAWSPDGRYLAYTLTDPAPDGPTDAWVFETEGAEFWQLTDVGNAFAASWVAREDADPLLWVSAADTEPTSYLTEPVNDTGHNELIDPAVGARATADGVFQPLLSPNGAFAIYWRGVMQRGEGFGWAFVEGGEPLLAQHDVTGETYRFDQERPVFSDLTIDQNAFTSASITWGGDGDAYAVWKTEWAGDSQGTDVQYPDPARVYFGHATDPRGLTQYHAIDADDIAEGLAVVDVKVSPTGRHLVITARIPLGGDLDTPRAELLLVERNTGAVKDRVLVLGSSDDGWIGPAAFDQTQEAVEP